MAKHTKNSIKQLVQERDYVALLASFDEDPDLTRRYLLRLAYDPNDPLHDETIACLQYLSQERSNALPEFFLETMRRQLWAMNEEGGNISWSAPEIICATVAGNPTQFKDFFSFAYSAAIDEMVFQPSLVKAYDIVARVAPDLVEPYANEIAEVRSRLSSSSYLGVSPG